MAVPRRVERSGAYAPASAMSAPVRKQAVLQHEGYMAVVRTLPCVRCGAVGVQFCHADMGKGMGLKTDCRRGFPGCPRCHALLGASGRIPRAERRELEAAYGRATRIAVLASGRWPLSLPLWPEDDL
jgi:hypothetical protein